MWLCSHMLSSFCVVWTDVGFFCCLFVCCSALMRAHVPTGFSLLHVFLHSCKCLSSKAHLELRRLIQELQKNNPLPQSEPEERSFLEASDQAVKIVPLWGKWRADKIGAFEVQAVIVDTGRELKFNSSFNELSYCETERPEPLQMSLVQAVCLCVFVISASRVSHRCCTSAVPHGEQLSTRFPPRDNKVMVEHRGALFRPGHALRAAVVPGGCSFSSAGGCCSVSAEQQLIKTVSVCHFPGIFRFIVLCLLSAPRLTADPT